MPVSSLGQRGTVRVTLKKRNKECYVKAGETVDIGNHSNFAQFD